MGGEELEQTPATKPATYSYPASLQLALSKSIATKRLDDNYGAVILTNGFYPH